MNLEELREELEAKRALLDQIFDEARAEAEDGSETQDLKQVECLGKAVKDLEGAEKAKRVAEEIQRLTDEVLALDEKITTAEAVERGKSTRDHFKSQVKRRGTPGGVSSVASDTGRSLTAKQIAQRVVNSDEYKAWRRGATSRIDIDLASWGDAVGQGTKALMSTTAGFQPESTRTGQVVDIPLRPPQIIDIMPRGTTGQQLVVYMQQTTRTQAAAEVAEGAAKPEATFVFAETSSPVQEVAVSLPVTNTQLEDVPFIAGLIESMLREDITERLDQQILTGDGIAPNLQGILNTPGILNVSAVGVDDINAIAQAGTAIRTGVARAVPTHVLLHPTDWDGVRLRQATDGQYLLGNPQDPVSPRIWGWPVVLNEELTPGTGLIGGFATRNIQLVERRGISVERGLVNSQFVQNQQTIRASMRAAVVVFRPAAFATITGLDGV